MRCQPYYLPRLNQYSEKGITVSQGKTSLFRSQVIPGEVPPKARFCTGCRKQWIMFCTHKRLCEIKTWITSEIQTETSSVLLSVTQCWVHFKMLLIFHQYCMKIHLLFIIWEHSRIMGLFRRFVALQYITKSMFPPDQTYHTLDWHLIQIFVACRNNKWN